MSAGKISAWLQKAITAHQAGNRSEAEALYRRVLDKDKNHQHALHFLGLLQADNGHYEDALRLIGQATKSASPSADVFGNQGRIYSLLNRHAEAIASYDKALAIDPRHQAALLNRGAAALAIGRSADALATFDAMLKLDPNLTLALRNRGIALFDLGRYEEAEQAFVKILSKDPNDPDALLQLGSTLLAADRLDEAAAAYRNALSIRPKFPAALSGLGDIQAQAKQLRDAEAFYNETLAIDPHYPRAWLGLGDISAFRKQHDDALGAYETALKKQPDLAEAWRGRAIVLAECRRYDEAIVAFDKAIALKPALPWLDGHRLHAKMHVCDWRNFDAEWFDLQSKMRNKAKATVPWPILALPSSPAEQLMCAKRYVESDCPGIGAAPVLKRRTGRIRVGYLSADFQDHATTHLMAGLLENHDKSRFEITAFSYGADDGSVMRARVVEAVDRFVDVREKSDAEAADLIREMEVDIAVDLKGFTADSRASILAMRPAPLQISYLGYPGTMGADYIDYIVADRVVIPEDQQEHYTEKVVYLPDSYQANDSSRPIGAGKTRVELILPADGFVFCSFNNSFKITPDVFGVWMRLLQQVQGSVLWLLEGNPFCAQNLKTEAYKRGIAPERLIFAPRMKNDEHLARQCAADLFLDTAPCNAHTTASDALWAGLPVLTCRSRTFAGSVAASLLTAVGLPELITTSLDQYEELALSLARDPAKLAAIQEKLRRNRSSAPLFDTQRFTRNIEAAYLQMWDRYQREEAPASFSVAASP